MKKTLFIFSLLLLITSCKSKHNIATLNRKTSSNSKITKSDKIVRNAKQYLGTKYQFGGVSTKGIDCSGLVYVAYKKEHVLLPRVSRQMALQGKTIPLNKVKKGDLLFFSTGKKNRINHVGMVTKVKNNQVLFIHASTKRGVVISSMQEKYYKNKFVKAKRIL